jgi:L-ribulokinase
MAGAVVAGPQRGGHADFARAIAAMTGVQDKVYTPQPDSAAVYEQLYRVYKQVHDAFGISGHTADVSKVMKQLLDIRDKAKAQ